MTMRTITITLALTLLAATAAGQSGSLYKQAQDEARQAMANEKVAQESPAAAATSLTAPPKANPRTFTKNQLITIIVRESATHATKGITSTSRDSSVDAKVDAWVKLTSSLHNIIQPVGFAKGKPAIEAEAEREFDGSGRSSRTDLLTARVTGRIIDIRPNGNLVIQASKSITTDEESYTITVTGVCRTSDVTPDNTVLSNQIAELEINKTSAGAVRKATERGLLHRLVDMLNLF
jgi:flagellar L-ring protein precursor FlgH